MFCYYSYLHFMWLSLLWFYAYTGGREGENMRQVRYHLRTCPPWMFLVIRRLSSRNRRFAPFEIWSGQRPSLQKRRPPWTYRKTLGREVEADRIRGRVRLPGRSRLQLHPSSEAETVMVMNLNGHRLKNTVRKTNRYFKTIACCSGFILILYKNLMTYSG